MHITICLIIALALIGGQLGGGGPGNRIMLDSPGGARILPRGGVWLCAWLNMLPAMLQRRRTKRIVVGAACTSGAGIKVIQNVL